MASRFLYVTYIRTTPEKLWDALTKPEFTKAYWCETWQESDWQVGSSWRLMIPDGRVGDFGAVVEYDPPRRLVLTWQNAFVPEMQADGPSRMTYELEPVGDTVKLTLSHESDLDGSKLIEGVSNGWPGLLASVKSLLETGEPLAITTKWPEGM
jgi:uncharacterized protein YndB with AHSA1/START domain